MSQEECIFCKIINKEIPTEFLYEDDLALAFRDIFPMASTHILIIPKEHIESVNELTDSEKHEKLMGRLIIIARKLAKQEGIDEKGYKLLRSSTICRLRRFCNNTKMMNYQKR